MENKYAYADPTAPIVEEDTGSDFDAIMNPDTPKLAPTYEGEDTGSDFEAITAKTPQPMPQQSQYQMMDYLKDSYGISSAGLYRGIRGFNTMATPGEYERVKDGLTNDAVAEMQKRTQNFEQSLPFWDTYKKWMGGATGSIPYMLEGAKGAAAGGLPAAGIGAGVALGLGQAGPQAATPEEVVTVPSMMAIFGARGATMGSVVALSRAYSGTAYLDLREKGISHENAKVLGLVSGAMQGWLDTMQFSGLGKAGQQALAASLKSTGGKAVFKAFLTDYLKETGEQIGQEGAQKLVEDLTTRVAGEIENNPNAKIAFSQIAADVFNEMVSAAGPSALLVGSSKGAGVATGESLKATAKLLDNAKLQEMIYKAKLTNKGQQLAQALGDKVTKGKMSLTEAFDLIKEGMDAAMPDPELIDRMRNEDPQTVLDSLTNPAIVEEEGPVLKTGISQTVDGSVSPTEGAPNAEVVQQSQSTTPQTGAAVAETETPAVETPAPEVKQPNTQLPSPEIKARQTTITKEKKSLQARMEQTQTQIAEREKAGKPTDQLNNRLAKLTNAHEDLDTEQALLEGGYLTEEDIKRAKVTLSAGEITSLRAKATQRIVKGFQQGIRTGIVQAKQGIKEVQTQLTTLINKSEMEAKDRAKFISKIKSIQTAEQLEKAMPEIQERIQTLIDTEENRGIKEKFTKLIKKSKPKKQGKRPIGKFTADIQKVLNAVRDLVSGKTDAQTIIRGIEAKRVKGETLTGEDLLTETLAEMIGDFKTASTQDIKTAYEAVENLMKSGRAENLEKQLAFKENLQNQLQTAVESIQGKDAVNAQPENEPRSRNTLIGAAKKWMKTLYAGLSDWDKLMLIASQNDKALASQTKTPLMKMLDTGTPLRQEYGIRQFWSPQIAGRLMDAMGLDTNGIKNLLKSRQGDKLLKQLITDSKVETQGAYTNQQGQTVPLVVSKAQARKIYMEMKSPDLRDGLERGNGYTFEDTHGADSTEALLDSILTEQDKQIVDAEFKLYNDFYQEINKWWRDKYGVDLAFQDFYSPAKRRVGGKITEESFFDTTSQMSMKPSSSIERVTNANPLELQNDILAMQQHVADWAHFMAWSDWDRSVKNIFYNPAVENIIKTKYGDNLSKLIKSQHQRLTGTKSEINSGVFKWFDDLRHKAGTAFVGGKLMQVPKQMTAIFGYLEYVNPVEFTEGLIDLLNNPVQAIETMESSPIMKERGISMDRDLREALMEDSFRQLRQSKSFLELMMLPVQFGDRLSIWGGGWSVYKKALKETGSQEKAMLAFEEATETTQQSGNPNRLSEFQQANSLSKMLSLFLTYPIQTGSKEIAALRNLANHPSGYTFKQAVKIVGLYHVVIPVMFQALVSGIPMGDTDDDVEKFAKLLRALIMGPFNGLPLLGDVIGYGLTQATDVLLGAKEKGYEPKFLPAGIMVDLVKGTKKMAKAIEEDNLSDGIEAIAKLSRATPLLPKALGGGLPLPALTKLFKDFTVDPDAENSDNGSSSDALPSLD